jgi:pyruvate formate-lyase activating enzyme-like uncharacterized protein
LTLSVLKELRDSGLDEIRFGLNEYDIDFGKLEKARKYIPSVMIEMPVFPNEEERAKKVLNEAERIKIFGVNIKELNYSGHNSDIFIKKGFFLKSRQVNPYHFTKYGTQPFHPIYGSEETCFKLLEYAIKRGFRMSVHYCFVNNKKDYLWLRYRRACSAQIKKPYETIAHNGLLKSIAVYFPAHTKVYRDLKRKNVPDEQIFIDKKRKKLLTHPCNLKFLDKNKYNIAILYYTGYSATGTVDIKLLNHRKNV